MRTTSFKVTHDVSGAGFTHVLYTELLKYQCLASDAEHTELTEKYKHKLVLLLLERRTRTGQHGGSVPISARLFYCIKTGREGGREGGANEDRTALRKGQRDRLTFRDLGSDCRRPSELGSCCGWRGCWPFP